LSAIFDRPSYNIRGIRMDNIGFAIKKLISLLAYPLGTSVLMSLLGLVLSVRKPRSKAGVALIVGGLAWLLVMGNPMVSLYLLGSLESQAGDYAQPAHLIQKGVKYIVVLGGDTRGGEVSNADRVATTSLLRVMEGVRIWKQMPGSVIIVSGGSIQEGMKPTALAMAAVAEDMGVPKTAIMLEEKSWDTDEEAKLLAPILGKKPFALVTSAHHILRSDMIFRRMGLSPIPAPCDFEARKGPRPLRLIPAAAGLMQSQKVIHEYLGITVVLIKNMLRPH
jgi:uncharacterized SAM-binding protein YcdF (DUF218 family)